MAEFDIAEADVQKRLQLWLNLRNVFQQRQGLFHGRVQKFRDRFSFVPDRKCLAIVTSAAANIAEHVDIGKEIHLDAFETIAFARLTTPAFDVEREAPGFITALARLRQHGVQLANRRKQSGVRRGIRSRRAANRRLVDLDYLVDVLQSFY